MVNAVSVSRYAFRKMMVIAALSEKYLDGGVRKCGKGVIWRPDIELVGDMLGEEGYISDIIGPENYNVGMMHLDVPIDEVEKKIKIPKKTRWMWNKICNGKNPHIFYGTSFFPKREVVENPPGTRIGQYHLHTSSERELTYLDKETMKRKNKVYMVVVVRGDIDIYRNSRKLPHKIANSGRKLSNEEIENMEASVKVLRGRLDRILKEHIIVPHGFAYSRIFPFNKIPIEDYGELSLKFGTDVSI